MQNLNGKRVVIAGGSQGLGLAMVEALAGRGANVIAIGRDRANLSSAEHAGAAVIAGDATDAAVMNKVVREEVPDVLILNAGARLPIKPIDQQNWDEFSTVWNTDVKAGLAGIQAALRTPRSDEARWPCSGHVKLSSNGACGAIHRARKLEPLRRLSRRQTDAVVHGSQCKRGIARA